MGLYIRKSIRVGPLRFNVSKSGIGISAGITGFRIGSGPRGNYVQVGRGGLYYRHTLPSSGDKVRRPPKTPRPEQNIEEPDVDTSGDIDSGDVGEMVDSTSITLLDEINTKRKIIRRWPAVCVFMLVIAASAVINKSMPWWLTTWVIFSAFFIIRMAVNEDNIRKTTVIFYELEDEPYTLYLALHEAYDKLATCDKSWHVEAESEIKDDKTKSGAETSVRRNTINLGYKAPPYVEINIDTPAISAGEQIIYFLPDKLLIFADNGVGAVSYSDIEIDISKSNFIVRDDVPDDAKIVDTTWEHVNKNGSPDRRFKDNKELSVALYEDIHFTSESGLNEQIQLSKTGNGKALKHAIRALGIYYRQHSSDD